MNCNFIFIFIFIFIFAEPRMVELGVGRMRYSIKSFFFHFSFRKKSVFWAIFIQLKTYTLVWWVHCMVAWAHFLLWGVQYIGWQA
jgi:hypothetical protein